MRYFNRFFWQNLERFIKTLLYARSEVGIFFISLIIFLWGVVLIIPGTPAILSVNPAHRNLLVFAPEWAWGFWFFLVGSAGFCTIWHGNFLTRKIVCLLDVMTLAIISFLMFIAGWRGAALAMITYSVLTLASIVNCFCLTLEENELSHKEENV